MTKANQTPDPFKNERQEFELLGKTYQYDFIPAIHFQSVLTQALLIWIGIEVVGNEARIKPDDENKSTATPNLQRVLDAIRQLLEVRIFEILKDVLYYQNGEKMDIETLRYRVRPKEIAAFSVIVVNDPELFEAMGEMNNGLGKTGTKILSGFSTPSSTPSSSESIKSAPTN